MVFHSHSYLILHIPAVLCVDSVKDISELFDFLAVKGMGEDLYMAEGREGREEREEREEREDRRQGREKSRGEEEGKKGLKV